LLTLLAFSEPELFGGRLGPNDFCGDVSRGTGGIVSDDLIEILERLKTGAYDAVTNNTGLLDDAEYKTARRLILGHPALGKLAPDWLRRATTAWEVRREISNAAGDSSGKWQRRREIVAEGFNPLLDVLEGAELAADQNLERLERLGSGGFGEVFRYRHKLVGVDFAVKVLDPAFAVEGDRSLERFLREARILFRLNHPNIVRIYDVGLLGRRPFIRMELVEGQTLNTRLSSAGSLSPREADRVTLALAGALAHAEINGVVHRDIKPSNVMLSSDGRVVLLDYGLGVFVEGDIVSRITKTGEAAAGGLYTAPELVANAALIDPKTDIYSLGALWYTMICGRPPAGIGSDRTLRSVADVPTRSVSLVLQCLAPAVDRPSAEELVRELQDG
jgi:eukaryotic-like serine/threonine-protein kinase